VLTWLRGLATRFGGVWLMVDDGEMVGSCCFKGPPEPDGTVSLGYGVEPERRGRGHATRAVTAMIAEARADPRITRMVATTAVANTASQRVLERNGFERTGLGYDPDDGDVVLWRLELPSLPLVGRDRPRSGGTWGESADSVEASDFPTPASPTLPMRGGRRPTGCA
jgi:RimJ/RimL family protein N-acetyltransferase